MTKSTAHTADDAQIIAKTLIMIAPSEEFAAGVVALAHALNAASPDMLQIIAQRWQYWTRQIEPNRQ